MWRSNTGKGTQGYKNENVEAEVVAYESRLADHHYRNMVLFRDTRCKGMRVLHLLGCNILL